MNSHYKSLAISFYKSLIGPRNSELAYTLISENYIQHNPTLPDGRMGVLGALEFLKQIPVPENAPDPIMRVWGEDNLVVLHLDVHFAGSRKAVIDIFRIENDQLVEHWDAIQDQPTQTANGNSMVNGYSLIEDLPLTEANKTLVEQFYNEVLISRNLDRISHYMSSELVQHHPDITNGSQGMETYLRQIDHQLVLETPARIIGEGNFVLTQSKGLFNGIPHVFYFIFRLKDHNIVEQWSVIQEIPEQMPHGNGMI